MEPRVTLVMPWIRAFPDLVALGSFSTELGDVKICLKACSAEISASQGFINVDTDT